MKVSDLKAHPGNPRRITDPELKRLRKTIELYGDLSGIVYNRRTGRMVGGHQRQKVLPFDADVFIEKLKTPDKTGTIAEGYVTAYGTRYTYREVDWPEDKEMAANIAANKSGGQFDDKMLADWLLDLDSKNVDIETTGFDMSEFENLCAPFRDMPAEAPDDDEEIDDEDAAEEPEKLFGECQLINSDCLLALKTVPSDSLDSIVTDPPYGFAFMGKKWDYELPSQDIWRECLRVLKPGGHLLAFGGPRTYHRLATGIEDAGFGVRDQLQWLFGSGFPKSLDISKAIDKAAGAEREVVGLGNKGPNIRGNKFAQVHDQEPEQFNVTAPTTPDAIQWSGWGTALKPANEPILLARKPLSEKTVAANVLKWGTGGLNIDGCRIEATGYTSGGKNKSIAFGMNGLTEEQPRCDGTSGRFPANLILDETAAEMLDKQSGESKSNARKNKGEFAGYGSEKLTSRPEYRLADTPGGASRFFYVAKASKSERNEHCSELEEQEKQTLNDYVNPSEGRTASKSGSAQKNHHPTVKPVRLMRYLARLVTPPNGIVLDPFMGSGTTGVAALKEEFKFIGVEREKEYFAICEKRLNYDVNKKAVLSE